MKERINGYVGFYKGQKKECHAGSLYNAQLTLAKMFNAKKGYEVSVILAEKDGEPVVHNAAIL